MTPDTIRFRPSTLLLVAWCIPAFLVATLTGVGIGLAAHLIWPAGSWPYAAGSLTWLIVFVIGAAGAMWHFFSIHYELDDRHISVCLGVFWKVCRTTPLEKITNIDIRQGPLGWLLGLGEIWIQTASSGSQEPEVKLTGLPGVKRVRDMILERCDLAKRGGVPSAGGLSAKETTDILAMLSQISETLKSIEKKLGSRG